MAVPPDEVVLLRTIWRDRDYDGDEIVASSVFPSDDLKAPRYLSVDRHDLLDESEYLARLTEQRQKGETKGDFRRKVPEVGFLPCWEVRGLRYEEATSPYLEVTDASAGFYESHCAIRNINKDPGRPSYNEIRRQLMLILHRYGIVEAFPKS